MKADWQNKLKRIYPYPAILKWARAYPDAETAWAKCERGDWMLSILCRVGADHKTIVLIASDCVRLVLRHIGKGMDRPLKVIETAEACARGEVSIEHVRAAETADTDDANAHAAHCVAVNAYAAAHAAADDVHAADVAACAYAASAEAYAASAASYVAASAAHPVADGDAAYAAAAAADCAAAAFYITSSQTAVDARKRTLSRCADFVRARLPRAWEVLKGDQ